MTAQGPELRALADTLREAGEKATGGPWFVHDFGREDGVVYLGIEPEDGPAPIGELSRAADCAAIVLLRNNLPTIISALERAAAAELPDPNGGCVCVAYPQDAGGGYTEWSTEYEPACPVHSEHVYDPRKGEWVLRAAAAEGEKAEAWDEGYSAAKQMPGWWGHTDHWEEPEPSNPYRSAS